MEMWNLAADLGLRVVERRGTHRSGYDPGDNTIHPTPARRGRVLRSVLAHEIGHHVLGHRPTDFGPIRKRQEHAANTWAARALITPDAYAAAEHHRDGHLPSMAFDLNVSDELAIIYRNSLLRTEQATYVAPKMGAGQFAHRLATG
ncbi:MAG TPA: ImmA/IrrE family metallo-endopeptidase [Microbacteriaceae bacterium]|jgi:hypothetical protein|nr:ImmA/IrrE family metallo-endopeptidase [Microbacteriaceae bacterium]HQX36693.1 ImmA/IrrE family metallo-endopeptidase [Microbacteriaceae bacterium]